MINIIGWIIVILNLCSMIIHLVLSMNIKKLKSKLTNRITKNTYMMNFYIDNRANILQDMFFIESDYRLLKKIEKYEDFTEPIMKGEFTGNEILYLSTLGMIHLQEDKRRTEVL